MLRIFYFCFCRSGQSEYATAVELEALKGVGPVKAKAIMDYRAKNGPFKSVDDLEKVPGFGKKTVDKLRADLTVTSGAAPAKAEGKAKTAADSRKARQRQPRRTTRLPGKMTARKLLTRSNAAANFTTTAPRAGLLLFVGYV